MSNTKIDLKTIQHMAKLSRLEVSETQGQEYALQLNNIMGFFDKISVLNTNGVEPLVTPTEIENFLREDKVENQFAVEDIVANAPSRQGSLFKVPPVV